MAPAEKAMMVLIDFTRKNERFDSAKRGKAPCPSCTIEFAKRILKGIVPDMNNDIKIMCGPDSGIIPTRTATIRMTHRLS